MLCRDKKRKLEEIEQESEARGQAKAEKATEVVIYNLQTKLSSTQFELCEARQGANWFFTHDVNFTLHPSHDGSLTKCTSEDSHVSLNHKRVKCTWVLFDVNMKASCLQKSRKYAEIARNMQLIRKLREDTQKEVMGMREVLQAVREKVVN